MGANLKAGGYYMIHPGSKIKAKMEVIINEGGCYRSREQLKKLECMGVIIGFGGYYKYDLRKRLEGLSKPS